MVSKIWNAPSEGVVVVGLGDGIFWESYIVKFT
jgi:hypothetical protein